MSWLIPGTRAVDLPRIRTVSVIGHRLDRQAITEDMLRRRGGWPRLALP
jgi:hypothetical protein